MFELIIFCVIVLAIGYWTALWVMGRRDDVLHGDFVQAEQRSDAIATNLDPSRASSANKLQSLLTAIKQDLKDAAQI
jgi:hypothetical protein